MYPFIVFVALALGLTVVMQVISEVLPVRWPAGVTRTLAVLIAAGFSWALNYSIFTAFHQHLRESWMNPIVTGMVLVGGGEFLRSVVGALGHRAGEPPVEVAPVSKMRAA